LKWKKRKTTARTVQGSNSIDNCKRKWSLLIGGRKAGVTIFATKDKAIKKSVEGRERVKKHGNDVDGRGEGGEGATRQSGQGTMTFIRGRQYRHPQGS